MLISLVIVRAEIVFSSNKSEGDREIDANEIMQLYRSDVLQYRGENVFLKKIPVLKGKSQHYIVVIEDLDRTDDNDAVVNFLKEGLEQSINKVMESNSDVIAMTFEERKRLELSLPNVVFSFEQLYIEDTIEI